jgi:putative nucleotidyltransferase with HDIG domain
MPLAAPISDRQADRPGEHDADRHAERRADRRAENQRDRLAWLFRSIQADGRPHPLLLPVACLRGDCNAASGLQPPAAPLPLSTPPQPRATLDRAALVLQVGTLPPLPEALADAQRVLCDEDSSSRACAQALGRDPALSAQVLRLANVAGRGQAGRVASLHDAVLLLGRRKLGLVLTAAAVVARFDAAACPGFDLAGFWRESLACAIAAQALAGELGADDGLAFTTGLLHDLGRLVLAVHLPAATTQALALARGHDQPLHWAERELLGIDHAELGALLARHWQFPPAMVAAIAGHHGPGQSAALSGRPSLTDLLQGADTVAHALDLHQAVDEPVPAVCPQLALRLQLTPERCARVLAVAEQGVDAAGQALGAG